MTITQYRLHNLVRSTLKRLDPCEITNGSLRLEKEILTITPNLRRPAHSVDLAGKNCYLVGFGKAVGGMAESLCATLGHRLVGGVLSLPKEIATNYSRQQVFPRRITVAGGAELNLPDQRAYLAAVEVSRLAESLSSGGDVLFVLISGGGSALLPLPESPITLEDLETTTKLLHRRGLTINQMNYIRVHLERLKGGRLASLARPAQCVSLIVSDTIGDCLPVIASGPTCPFRYDYPSCLEMFRRFGVYDDLPANVLKFLQWKCENGSCDQPSTSNAVNVLLANNQLAIDVSMEQFNQLGFKSISLSSSVEGDVELVAEEYCRLVDVLSKSISTESPDSCHTTAFDLFPSDKVRLACEEIRKTFAPDGCGRFVVVNSGEITVNLSSSTSTSTSTSTRIGKGGRSQHLGLLVARRLNQLINDRSSPLKAVSDQTKIFLTSFGTDGQDGPTEAAGATVTPLLYGEAVEDGLDIDGFIGGRASFEFFSSFRQGQYHVVTGPSGVNFMDLHWIVFERK